MPQTSPDPVPTTPSDCATLPDESGQASAEYALVLLGAAAVAVLVITWATGTDRIGDLLDAVVDSVLKNVR